MVATNLPAISHGQKIESRNCRGSSGGSWLFTEAIYRSRSGVGPSDRPIFDLIFSPRSASTCIVRSMESCASWSACFRKGRYEVPVRNCERSLFSGPESASIPYSLLNAVDCFVSWPRSFRFSSTGKAYSASAHAMTPLVLLIFFGPNQQNMADVSHDRPQFRTPPALHRRASPDGGSFRTCTTRARPFPVFP